MMTLQPIFAVFLVFSVAVITEAQVDVLLFPSDDQYKELNETLSLTCEVLGGQNPEWYGPDGNVILDLTQTGFDPKRYVQKIGNSMAELWFDKIEQSHGGIYRCEAQGESDEVEITIIEDIQFVNAPLTQHLILGEDGFIHCEVTSHPPATLHWKFNDNHISSDDHYVFESNGLKINEVTQADEGTFNCRARVKETGRVKSVDIEAFVYELPTFVQVPENTSSVEGNKAEFSCDAVGMPTPDLKWRVGALEIQANDKYSLSDNNRQLIISDLNKGDQGTYTCMADNPISHIEASAFLLVHTFPKIGTAQNKTVEEGNNVYFSCSVTDGSPKPELKWKWNDEELYYGSQPSNPRMEIDEQNGVLLLYIDGVTSDDVGIYTCEATNYAGKDSKDFYLNVEHPPYIDESQTPFTEYSWIGHTVHLPCVVIGFPQPTIHWEHFGNVMHNATVTEIGFNTYKSTLTVMSDTYNFGDYICKAENKLDSVEHTIIVEETFVPDAPATVKVLATGPTSVTFIIVEPENHGGWPIESCKVHINEGIDGNGRDLQQIFQGVGEEETFEGLEGGTEYTIAAQCMNKVGYGEISQPPVLFKTESYSKPQSPMIISPAKSDSQTAYTLEWMAGDDGGKEITSYAFTYGENKAGDKSLWKVVNGISPTTTEYTIEDLKANTGYRIQLKAINDIGSSDDATIDILTAEGKQSNEPVYAGVSTLQYCSTLILLCIISVLNIVRT